MTVWLRFLREGKSWRLHFTLLVTWRTVVLQLSFVLFMEHKTCHDFLLWLNSEIAISISFLNLWFCYPLECHRGYGTRWGKQLTDSWLRAHMHPSGYWGAFVPQPDPPGCSWSAMEVLGYRCGQSWPGHFQSACQNFLSTALQVWDSYLIFLFSLLSKMADLQESLKLSCFFPFIFKSALLHPFWSQLNLASASWRIPTQIQMCVCAYIYIYIRIILIFSLVTC